MSRPISSVQLDQRTEAAVRHLRTLLEEARGLLQASTPDERTALIEATIERLQTEAQHFAPDWSEMKAQAADFAPF